jgi:PST family polysaccharide transporter
MSDAPVVSGEAGAGGAIAAAPGPAPALGRAAATGFLLMSGQSLLTRVLTLAAQVVVARVLTPAEFGVVFIAMSVARYSDLAQAVGVREVLLARQKRFHLWENAGWWVAIAAGLAAALATAAAAPIMAWIYGNTTLLWLMLIVAVSQPLYNVTLVQEAKLQVELRFKYSAMGQLAQNALGQLAQIVFALLRMGSYALVVPRVVMGAAKWWIYSGAARVNVRRDPQLRLWKYILIPGGMVVATNLAYNLAPTVPTLVLGRVGGAASEIGESYSGFFNFAFNLSLQSMMLLSMQLDSILFPTLGKMAGDPVRQRGALLRSGHALAAVMAPVCAFQIVAAQPVIELFFSPGSDLHKWDGAVLSFQMMSAAMFVAGALVPAHSLLQSQSRFGTKLWIVLLWGVVGVVVSVAGIMIMPQGRAVDAATLGLALFFVASPLHQCVAAARPLGGGFGDAFKILAMPALIGAAAGGAAWAADHYGTPAAGPTLQRVADWVLATLKSKMPPDVALSRVTDVFRIGVMGVVGGVSYLGLLRVMAPGVWKDMLHAAEPILRRVRVYLPRALREKSV